MASRKVDPITTEVIRYELVAAAEEMREVFKRTTMMALLYEYNDFGLSIYDAEYNMLADAPGLPMFTGTLHQATRACVSQIGRDKLRPGDVLMTSVPFDVGSQPVDAALVTPIFWEKDVIGYATLKAHMGDLGALDPYPTNTTDMFQEGLILPAMRLYRGGELNEELVRLIKANSRIPVNTAGNFLAGAAAVRTGAERVRAVVEEHGLETFRNSVRQILDHGEQMTRKAIKAMPDGSWTVEDYMDNNGVEDEPVKIVVTVTVKGTEMIVDLTGSAPQQNGPINCPYPGVVSICRYALKALTVPDTPANEGHFRPLKVIAPLGSMYNPTPPAPTFLYGWSSMRLVDLVTLALAKATPEKVPASSGSDLPGVLLWYFDHESGRGEAVGAGEVIGMGATNSLDGENALIHHTEAGCCNIPVEVMENRAPMLVERYELRTDSGGPGKFRGGLGVRRDYQTLAESVVIFIMERISASQPRGLHGGLPGKRGVGIFYPGTDREARGGKMKRTLKPGEGLAMESPGGGGYGNPFLRDPQKVLADVRNGYVSLESAQRDYGVVLDTERWLVDENATRQLRNLTLAKP